MLDNPPPTLKVVVYPLCTNNRGIPYAQIRILKSEVL